MQRKTDGPLRIGFIGSSFKTGSHLQALLGVRDVQVTGVFGPTRRAAPRSGAPCSRSDASRTSQEAVTTWSDTKLSQVSPCGEVAASPRRQPPSTYTT